MLPDELVSQSRFYHELMSDMWANSRLLGNLGRLLESGGEQPVSKNYDLVILGAGVGGYVAGIRAAQLGMKVAIVEKDQIGGVCLHRGCIPSKTLLKSAEFYHELKQSERYGIRVSDAVLDFPLVQARKKRVVDQLHKGLQQLLRQYPIDLYHGKGRILGPSIFSPQPGTISVEFADGRENQILIPQYVIIATGSRPRTLPGWELDGKQICFSDHMLELERLPDSVVIIGGGAIGIEWASLLNDMGVQVTVVEAMDRILPFEDEDISLAMKQSMERRNITIYTGVKAHPEWSADRKYLLLAGEKVPAEKVIISIGRVANTSDIGLQNTSIQVEQGWIQVNSRMQTAESHIYAIGDVVGGYQLAHVAAREGMIAVEHMAGKDVTAIDPHMVPRCIYSRPEVGSIGLSESEAVAAGFKVKVGKFPLQSLGKAVVAGKTEGFIKMIADQKTDDLLGVHMIGAQATELIAEAGLAKVLDATPWEIAQPIYPHPTLSEAFGEVGLAVDGTAIHSIGKIKVAD